MFSKFKIVFLFALLFLFSAQASAAFFDFRAPELFKKIPNSKSLDLSNRVRVKVPGVLTIEPYWYGAHQNIQASIPMDSIFVKLTAQVEAFKITTLTYRKVGTEPVSDFGDVVLYEYERPRGLNREIARGTFNSDGMIRFKNENGLIFVRSGEEKFVFIKAETKATAAGGEVSLALAINEEDKEFLLQYDTYVIPGMVLDEPENWVNFSVINISFSLANADAARPISCVRTPELCLGLPLDGPRMYF